MFDQSSDVAVLQSIAPQSIAASATVEGAAVSLEGYNSATVVISQGALGGGAANYYVQESANGTSGWATIPEARLKNSHPTLTFTSDKAPATANTSHSIAVTDIGGLTKPFIRAAVDVVGGTGALCAADVVRGRAAHGPAGRSGADSILIS